MATKTEIYELRKKEENDFYNVEDFNNNMDTLEKALTEFDDTGTAEGVTSFPEMLTKLVTGNKLAITLKNLKAGLQFVLHAGSIVNNCVTDNANLPVSAAMAKSLQDQINQANSNIGKAVYSSDLLGGNTTGVFIWYNGATANTPYKAGLTSATEGVCLKMEDLAGYLSIYAFVKGGSEIFVYVKNPTTAGKWEKMI